MDRIRSMFSGLAVAVFASGAEAQTLPNFEFRGMVVGQDSSPEAGGFKRRECKNEGSEIILCTRTFDQIAGAGGVGMYWFYRNQLARMRIEFEGGPGPVMRALEARYGKPCRVGSEVVQNRLGAKVDNATAIWCFRTGLLQIKQIGVRLGYSSVEFVDTALVAQIPKPEPNVDF